MTTSPNRPDACRCDALLTRVDLVLDRLSIGVLAVAIPLSQARLPYSHQVALAGIACTGVSVVFALLIKLAKIWGLVGSKLLDDKAKTNLIDGSLDMPVRRVVPIAQAATPAAIGNDEQAATHRLEIAGVGTIIYRVTDTRRA